MFTSLPTEIIQEIAWLSFNPSLYQVSHSLRHHLIQQSDFAHDLAILLLCDRQKHDSAWLNASLPWRSPQARSWDLMLTPIERECAQRLVFDLQYMTISRFVSMVRYTLRLWIDMNASFTRYLASSERQRLDDYLSTTEDFPHGLMITDTDGNQLRLVNGSKASLLHAESQRLIPASYIVYVEYVPTRLLTVEKQMESSTFSRTLMRRTRMDGLNHQIVRNRTATAKPKWME